MSVARTDSDAREALRQRQGKGARYDAPNAPAEDLLIARRGVAYFARKLVELKDEELYQPSAKDGLSRAHIVARVSYAARSQALALEALGKQDVAAGAMLELRQFGDLDLAATLPARALRHLFHHAQVHLNVCWRDLDTEQWEVPVGRYTTVRHLPAIQAGELWYGALDLKNGARGTDVPPGLSRPQL